MVDKVADKTAWTKYKTGATNKKVNSIGSVMPQRTAVTVAGIKRAATFLRFSGLAQ